MPERTGATEWRQASSRLRLVIGVAVGAVILLIAGLFALRSGDSPRTTGTESIARADDKKPLRSIQTRSTQTARPERALGDRAPTGRHWGSLRKTILTGRGAPKAGSGNASDPESGSHASVPNPASGGAKPKLASPKRPSGVEIGTQPVNLLQRIDPASDTVSGTWKFEGEMLLGSGTNSRLKISIAPPGEYQLRMTVERVTGSSGLVMGLFAAQKRCTVFVDNFGGKVSGVAPIDGHLLSSSSNETAYRQGVLTNNKPASIVCTVRRDRLVLEVDGATIVDWSADYSRVSRHPTWSVPDGQSLFLAINNSNYRFARLELMPLVAGRDVPEPAQPPQIGAGQKLRVPNDEATQQSLQKIKEVFADDYMSARKRDDKVALAHKLLSEAKATADDSASSFTLSREALNLATEAVEPALALQAIDEIAGVFDVDALAMRSDAMTQMVRAAKSTDARKLLAPYTMEVATQAARVDRHDIAVNLATLAYETAARARDAQLRKQTSSLRDQLRQLKKWAEAASEANDTLKQQPNDPAAKQALGKFLCLVKGDWEQGLPHLAKASDKDLQVAAKLALAKPTNAAQQAQLGDAWWNLAKSATDQEKPPLQIRARRWYRQAIENISGLERAHVQKRLDELSNIALPVSFARVEPKLLVDASDPEPTFSSAVDPDRRAVLYALSTGGRANIGVEGRATTVKRLEDVPAAPFTVTYVWLESKNATNADLGQLSDAASLFGIYAPGLASDADVLALRGLPKLNVLSITGPKITDVSIRHIVQSFPALRDLGLNATNVTDAGMADLKTLSKLNALNLSDTPIGDAGVEHLKMLNLRVLRLNGTQVTDAALTHIAHLKSAESIFLSRTNITGLGLMHLKNMEKLTYLRLDKTSITAEQARQLKRSLPECRIYNVTEIKN